MSLPLREMFIASTASPVVLLYLLQVASRTGKRTVATDRRRIAAATGLSCPKGITRAIKALAALNLVKYRVKTKIGNDGQTQYRFYVISLGKRAFNALMDNSLLPRKGVLNALKVNAPCPVKGVQTPLLSKERGGCGLSLSATATPQPLNGNNTTPSMLEQLKELRTKKNGGQHG